MVLAARGATRRARCCSGSRLLSKESAIVPAAAVPVDRGRGAMEAAVWPHAVLATLAAVSVAQSHANSFRFNDGSFDLHAPFWITWPAQPSGALPVDLGIARGGSRSGSRAIANCGVRRGRALVWIGVAMMPYLLPHLHDADSQPADVSGEARGLAMLVGLAASRVRGPSRRWWALAGGDGGPQRGISVDEEARSVCGGGPRRTAELIAMAERTRGRIWVRCFSRLPAIDAEAGGATGGWAGRRICWCGRRLRGRWSSVIRGSSAGVHWVAMNRRTFLHPRRSGLGAGCVPAGAGPRSRR